MPVLTPAGVLRDNSVLRPSPGVSTDAAGEGHGPRRHSRQVPASLQGSWPPALLTNKLQIQGFPRPRQLQWLRAREDTPLRHYSFRIKDASQPWPNGAIPRLSSGGSPGESFHALSGGVHYRKDTSSSQHLRVSPTRKAPSVEGSLPPLEISRLG